MDGLLPPSISDSCESETGTSLLRFKAQGLVGRTEVPGNMLETELPWSSKIRPWRTASPAESHPLLGGNPGRH